jgi:hypothetical protein
MYGGQHPVLRTSKFTLVYCKHNPFKGNVHMVIPKREIMFLDIRTVFVTFFKNWKL